MKCYMLFILIISSILLNSGCNNALDSYSMYESVVKEYPNSIIFRVPDHTHLFIVKMSNEVWYVKCTSMSSPEVTHKIKVFDIGK